MLSAWTAGLLDPITGQPPEGLTPDKSRIRQSHDFRADVFHVPAVLVPGLRPVSVKEHSSSAACRSHPPLTELALLSAEGQGGLPARQYQGG